MLNVMIIDDEPIIREGLKTIIDWGAYGYTICGEAANGQDGLDKIIRLQPDLAIVDIKMPIMDGLQMIRELRNREIPCECIVLSAYSDFRFAQQAIELGIGSYILKPIEQEELIEKIEKIQDAILVKQQTKQQLAFGTSLSKNKILQSILLGQTQAYGLNMQYEVYGLDFPWKSYQVGLVEMGKKAYEMTDLRVALENEVNVFVAENNLGYAFSIDRYVGILFRNSANMRILNELHKQLEQISGPETTISLGPQVPQLEAVKSSYQTACRLIEKKFLYIYKRIITGQEAVKAGKANDWKSQTISYDMKKMMDDLYSAIDGESVERINDLLEHIRNTFIQEERDEALIKIDYSNLYIEMMGRLGQSNEHLKSYTNNRQDVLAEICSKTSLQELHGYIKFVFLAVTEELSRLRPSDPVKKIMEYIARNYSQDLKLETLAVLFHYNSAYLGKLIRAKTGVQFSTYLDCIRIEEAKRLLKEGHKVYEAAQMTGFRYVDYFYKKFKKYVGVSPMDYKGND